MARLGLALPYLTASEGLAGYLLAASSSSFPDGPERGASG